MAAERPTNEFPDCGRRGQGFDQGHGKAISAHVYAILERAIDYGKVWCRVTLRTGGFW